MRIAGSTLECKVLSFLLVFGLFFLLPPGLLGQTPVPNLSDYLDIQRHGLLMELKPSQGDFIVPEQQGYSVPPLSLRISDLGAWTPGTYVTRQGPNVSSDYTQLRALFSIPPGAIRAPEVGLLPVRRAELAARYEENALQELRLEIYGPIGLIQQVFFDDEELLTVKRLFGYRDDGRIVSIHENRKIWDDRAFITRYRWVGDILNQIAESFEDELVIRGFDASGRQFERKLYRGGILQWQEEWDYFDDSEVAGWQVDRSYLTDSSSVDREVSTYSTKGLLVAKQEYEGQEQVSEEILNYEDGSTRLLSQVTRRKEFIEERRYQYQGDQLIVEEIWENTQLVRKIRYPHDEADTASESNPATSIEEIYRRGEVVLRVYYRDGQRYREEVISGGRIVRTREYSLPTRKE